MLKRTALYLEHKRLGAKMVPFAGWEMPLHYGSQIAEHHDVRNHAGIFDVSHMGVIEVEGKQAQAFLRYLLANDVVKLQAGGKGLYSCLLNHAGGILDDLLVYCLDKECYRLVVNAATVAKDLSWLEGFASAFGVKLAHRSDLAILAIQGPQIDRFLSAVFNQTQWQAYQTLTYFRVTMVQDWFIARTGYTGEKGIEIILPTHAALSLWQQCIAAHLKPIGLGARDSLRLEAGFNLYSQDMDETVSPFESNLSWTIDWSDTQRDFLGKQALLAQKNQGINQQLVGVILQAKNICRPKMKVWVGTPDKRQAGLITSGGFSPTKGCSIGLARIPMGNFTEALIEIRDQKIPAQIIKPPFIPHRLK